MMLGLTVGLKPKSVVVICVRDIDGYVDEIRYLKIYNGGQMIYCMDSFTGYAKFPHIGTMQGVDLKAALERWPHMDELIKAARRRRMPRL